ncbi:MAG TPA: CaiB/BaiF CoA-transferase family protein [Salinivirgaceae bacterium]|nr:CaiB/BaiF CoA-transferase family protein [Salinivirgaceae bacterium]
MSSQILSGIKVIELASVLAGPSIGTFLAELGAQVIKVENISTDGDVTRKWKLPKESQETDISGYFSCVNWGKTSLALDLTINEGLEIIYRLSDKADIILVSYKPGDAEKLKVDYNTLSKRNPRLIYAHITGYGLDNPRAGFDAIIQAESGFIYMNGEPDGPPTKMPVALMDVLAAHHLKEAILLALLHRERTGQGQHIEASLFRAGVASLVNQATNWLVGKEIPKRLGSDHPNIVPYGTIFKTADQKEIVLAVGTEKQFAELCEVLGVPQLASDPKFSKNYYRVINKDELKQIIQSRIATFKRDEILRMLDDKKVPAGGVFNMEEVFNLPESKPMVMQAQYANGQTIKGVRSIAFTTSNQFAKGSLTPPPHYGENSREILKNELNYSDQEIEKLIQNKVIYEYSGQK